MNRRSPVPRDRLAAPWRWVFVIVIGCIGALGLAASPAGSSVETGRPSTSPFAGVLKDVDGTPLPFASVDEVLEFLTTAEVESIEELDRGVTNPRRVVLQRDGVRARAIFRDVNIFRKKGSRHIKTDALYFRDRFSYEVAAFELARLLEIDRVPPVVLRKIDGTKGSLQIWLEDVIMNVDRRDRGLDPPDAARWNQQNQILKLFDSIAGNLDRNLGNLLIDGSWSIWYIDHTRCFIPVKKPLKPERVTRCERAVWNRMKSLDNDAIHAHMKTVLNRSERVNLVARFRFMVDHIEQLILDHGEDEILFDLAPPQAWTGFGAAGSE